MTVTKNMTASGAALSAARKFPPYIKQRDTVRSMMADVLIALVPAAVWGVYKFGLRALLIIAVSTAAAAASEALFDLAVKRPLSVGDLSAVVTGVLLAFCLPSTVPLYVPAVGAVFAVVVVKCFFGGIGCNILNPALSGAVFVRLCFPEATAVTGDPLSVLKSGGMPEASYYDVIVGNIPGNIGEVSALLLIAGGVYLIIRGVIDWRAPVFMIGSVVLVCFLIPDNVSSFNFVMYEVFSGSLIMTALFMATDPVTSPATASGRAAFGVLAGVLTMLLRICGTQPEGVAYAVLTANLLSGVIDRITAPKPARRESAAAAAPENGGDAE